MKLLVTGGAGFIGSNLVESLTASRHQVTIIDDLSTGKLENVHPDAEFINADIGGPELEGIVKSGRFDAVFHLAAQIDVRKSVENPCFDAEINILGGIKLLNQCVKFGVKKVIFSSTGGAIYGEQEQFPATESHPTNPVSPYGIAKLSFEKYLHFYKMQFGLSYVSLRYANVYGPKQNPLGEAGVIAIFCSKLLNGEKAVVNGDGLQTRDFVYVDDVVTANLSALNFRNSDIFNVGTGIETKINSVFDIIKNASRSPQPRINSELKPGRTTPKLHFP